MINQQPKPLIQAGHISIFLCSIEMFFCCGLWLQQAFERVSCCYLEMLPPAPVDPRDCGVEILVVQQFLRPARLETTTQTRSRAAQSPFYFRFRVLSYARQHRVKNEMTGYG